MSVSKHLIWKTSISHYAVNLLSYISSVLINLLSVDCVLFIFKSTNKVLIFLLLNLLLSLQCITLVNHCTYYFLLKRSLGNSVIDLKCSPASTSLIICTTVCFLLPVSYLIMCVS
jgi:hypothetical protein